MYKKILLVTIVAALGALSAAPNVADPGNTAPSVAPIPEPCPPPCAR